MDLSQAPYESIDLSHQLNSAAENRVETAPGMWPSAPGWTDVTEPNSVVYAEDRKALDLWLDTKRLSTTTIPATPPLGPLRHAGNMAARLSQSLPLGGSVTEAVSDASAWPMTAIGRLTVGFGQNRRFCSAFVVAERVIATAAHCVYRRREDENAEPGWVTFEPQAVATQSAGIWSGQTVYLPRDWTSNEDVPQLGKLDFAFIVLAQPIIAKTGAVGIEANPDEAGPFLSLGYPRKPTRLFEFDGRFLFASTGAMEQSLEGQMLAQNGLTEGASGGPWFVLRNSELLVGGLSASKPVGEDDTSFSPRIGVEFFELLSLVLADLTGV